MCEGRSCEGQKAVTVGLSVSVAVDMFGRGGVCILQSVCVCVCVCVCWTSHQEQE
jgi:hypothetical protein